MRQEKSCKGILSVISIPANFHPSQKNFIFCSQYGRSQRFFVSHKIVVNSSYNFIQHIACADAFIFRIVAIHIASTNQFTGAMRSTSFTSATKIIVASAEQTGNQRRKSAASAAVHSFIRIVTIFAHTLAYNIKLTNVKYFLLAVANQFASNRNFVFGVAFVLNYLQS